MRCLKLSSQHWLECCTLSDGWGAQEALKSREVFQSLLLKEYLAQLAIKALKNLKNLLCLHRLRERPRVYWSLYGAIWSRIWYSWIQLAAGDWVLPLQQSVHYYAKFKSGSDPRLEAPLAYMKWLRAWQDHLEDDYLWRYRNRVHVPQLLVSGWLLLDSSYQHDPVQQAFLRGWPHLTHIGCRNELFCSFHASLCPINVAHRLQPC